MIQIYPSVLSRAPSNQADRDHFLAQYRKQKLYSYQLAFTATLLGVAALKEEPVVATAYAIAAMGVGAFWYTRSNDPKNLALKAFKALGKKWESETCPCEVEPAYQCPCKDEKTILEILRKGADLDKRFVFDPQLPAESILEYAARQGYLGIVKYLVGLGFSLEATKAARVAAFVRTVVYLEEKGVSLDSALEPQFMRLVKAVKTCINEHEGRAPVIEDACSIIRFLRHRGVTRDPQLAPHFVDLFHRWEKLHFTALGRSRGFIQVYEDWSVIVKSERKSLSFFIPSALVKGGIDPFNYHERNRAEFLYNYRTKKLLSHGLVLAAIGFIAATIFYTMRKKSFHAIASAIDVLIVGLIWYSQPEDSKNLALAAVKMMKERNYEVNHLLKKGADIDVRISVDPQLPPDNLLEYAARQGYDSAVQYLVGIGFNIADTRALHVAAYPSIVEFLAKKGVPVDPDGDGQSPLESHFLRLLESVKNSMDSKKEKFPQFEYEREIIAFLLANGAKKVSSQSFPTAEHSQLFHEIMGSIASPEKVLSLCIWYSLLNPCC